MPPDLALLSTLTGWNYPGLELIFMVPKVFELLKFDCTIKFDSAELNLIVSACNMPSKCGFYAVLFKQVLSTQQTESNGNKIKSRYIVCQ